MKLGIAVVYMALEQDAPLLDLHLRFIARHTQVPYTIYAAANRLPADMRQRVAETKCVEICSIPTTDLRGSRENAYYLERLIQVALDDGSTHVVTMHVDSFPVRSGWATTLAEVTSGEAAFAAIVRDEETDPKPMTACLFFPRGFHERHRPRLLLSPDARRSAVGRAYIAGLANPDESGTGYGYVAAKEGLSWKPLRRSNEVDDHYFFGSIHGDLVFHLGSAGHPLRTFPGTREYASWIRLRRAVASRLPMPVRRFARAILPGRALLPESAGLQAAYDKVHARLLSDPDAYIARLRFGEGRTGH